jgi:hypothetical protein
MLDYMNVHDITWLHHMIDSYSWIIVYISDKVLYRI